MARSQFVETEDRDLVDFAHSRAKALSVYLTNAFDIPLTFSGYPDGDFIRFVANDVFTTHWAATVEAPPQMRLIMRTTNTVSGLTKFTMPNFVIGPGMGWIGSGNPQFSNPLEVDTDAVRALIAADHLWAGNTTQSKKNVDDGKDSARRYLWVQDPWFQDNYAIARDLHMRPVDESVWCRAGSEIANIASIAKHPRFNPNFELFLLDTRL